MAFVRYQTVRNIGLGVLGAGAIAGIVVAATGSSTPPPSSNPPASVVERGPTPSPRPSPAAALDDAAIVARADQPATPGEKIKDAFKGHATKVNLYEETNDRIYDRLKIDANRDDTWDVQWTRTPGGQWQREDGALFVGGAWAAAAAPSKEPVVTPPADVAKVDTPPVATEPYAEQLATVAKTMLEGKAKGGKLKDLFRGSGPKVNLYDDDKDGHWDRAKIDYERDEVDDEKLTLKGGTLERKNEKSGVVQVFDHGAWKAKP